MINFEIRPTKQSTLDVFRTDCSLMNMNVG